VNCSGIAEATPLYLADELPASQRREFVAHLNGCRSCASEVEQWASVDVRLRAAVGYEMPSTADLDRSVMRQIRSDSLTRRRGFMVGAAALVLLAAGSAWWVRPAAVPRLYADAARDHRLEVVDRQQRRWHFESSEVNALAGRFGLSGTDVTRLAPAGYRLEHAKICGLDGEPALHLVYASSAREVSLYVRRNSATPAGQLVVGSEVVDVLRTRRFTALVVAQGPRADCVEFAQFAAARL
jgi:anti-sigma factor RsiW